MREIGQTTPEPGLYRCAICGAEVSIGAGESFPACEGRDHSPRWVLSEERVMTAAGAERG